MLTHFKNIIEKNFSSKEIKVGLLIVAAFISYFIGRFMGIFYSHYINS